MNLVSSFDRLVNQKLATKRLSPDGLLGIYKYSKRVFFDSLWNEDALIADARGIVIDQKTGAIVQYPFTKVYNFTENGAGMELKDSDMVDRSVKWNGFMAAVCNYNGQLLVTTTGSFDSPFVDLAKEVLGKNGGLDLKHYTPGFTYMFEICDPKDPHIIETPPGAYLIGIRSNEKLGTDCFSEAELLEAYKKAQFQDGIFPNQYDTVSWELVKNEMKSCKLEGYMIRKGVETLCKFKSPYYLRLKFLSRAHFFLKPDFDPKKVKETIEEEFYHLVDFIFDYGTEKFKALTPDVRVAMLREQMEKQQNKVFS